MAPDAAELQPFTPEPTDHVLVVSLPAPLLRRLTTHCCIDGENLDAAVTDALALFLDGFDLVEEGAPS